MKYLIVVDMQDKYLQNKSKYLKKDELIDNINAKIETYKNNVIYVKNKALGEVSNFIASLDIESENIFLKTSSSCFSSDNLRY